MASIPQAHEGVILLFVLLSLYNHSVYCVYVSTIEDYIQVNILNYKKYTYCGYRVIEYYTYENTWSMEMEIYWNIESYGIFLPHEWDLIRIEEPAPRWASH